MMDTISIRGARTHNLKSVDVDIPRNKFVVITGLSGSGKSSLAFDTLYAEGQRRYAESISSYARRFVDILDKPEVDSIEGLSPSIAIGQHTSTATSRSTVATVTEIADYMRLLFARAGTPYCPDHHAPLTRSGIHDMVDAVLKLPEDTKIMILAPIGHTDMAKQPLTRFMREVAGRGFVRVRIDGEVVSTDTPGIELPQGEVTEHMVEVIVDRVKVSDSIRSRLAESFETAVKLTEGKAMFVTLDDNVERRFQTQYGCPECGYSLPEITPAMFSFNNALGACPVCQGTGAVDAFDPAIIVRSPGATLTDGAVCGWSIKNRSNYLKLKALSFAAGFSVDVPFNTLDPKIQTLILYGAAAAKKEGLDVDCEFEGVITELDRQWEHARSETTKVGMRMLRTVGVCPSCRGARYRREVHDIYIGQGDAKMNITEMADMGLSDLVERLKSLEFDEQKKQIAVAPLSEICRRLSFLIEVGLGYLTLSREASTLSGGEMQRIRLAGQIGAGLTGVTYVLDEPTIGLHQRDNARVIEMMKRLTELGNTVVVVEHDIDVIRAADYLVDMGPGAGELGGEVVAAGTPEEVSRVPASRTGAYLSGRAVVELPARKPRDDEYYDNQALKIIGAHGHNLKNLTVSFPVGAISVVTGVSGSGKSSLVNETLAAYLRKYFYKAKEKPLPFEGIEGVDNFDKIVDVDQSPIGRTPRSNPASYTGLLTLIRDVFAQTNAAKERGYEPGRFSFNTVGGRCEACEGDGQTKIEMGFLPPVYVMCPTCQGRRYNRETLEVKYRDKSIADVLEMTVSEALEFFSAWPVITRKLQTLMDVGLGYIRLGQSAMTFSGGEAQRIKLAEELSRRDTGRTLYVLDEPTTGLHFEDVAALMSVLHRLTELGNTVIVIEHNLDVIRLADHVIDIGPDGGSRGGNLVVEGTPEEVAACKASETGHYLAIAMYGAPEKKADSTKSAKPVKTKTVKAKAPAKAKAVKPADEEKAEEKSAEKKAAKKRAAKPKTAAKKSEN